MNKEEMIEAIRKEQSKWIDKQYAGKDKKKRQEKGQFFTSPELCYELLKPFIEGNKHAVNNSGMVDPMAGSGNLLAAAIVTGVRKPEEVFANELDPDIYKVLKDRLTSLGVPEKNIYNEDALDENLYNKIKKQTDFIDVIANPDFKLGNKAISEAIKHLGPTGRVDKNAYRAMNNKHSKPLFNVKYDYRAGPFDGQVIDDIIDDFDEETANEYSELLDNEGEISAVEYLRQKDPESPIVKDLIGQIKNPDSLAAGSDFPEEWEPYEADSNEGKSFEELWNPHGKFAQVNPRLKDFSPSEIENLRNADRIINKRRSEGHGLGLVPKDKAIEFVNKIMDPYIDRLPEDVKDEMLGNYYKWVDSDIDNWYDFLDSEIESNPEEFVNSSSPEIAEEAQQITNDTDKRNDKVNNANIEKALRKTIPGSEPDPLGVNISNEERANWNGGKDRAVGDATLSEMDNALASRTRPVKPGTEMLDRAQPKGLLGAGMLYSRDENIPKPSEERPLDANNLEQITESNPEAVQEALPNTPIAEEARQITDDNNARNDEVNNGAAEETIGMGWNNGLVHDDYDPRVEANNEYEYPENVGNPGVITEKDEDFAGPDELPATIDQIRDEDFVGPDEQLDKYRGGLPEELYTEPVYDTSDYNFDWNAVIETLPPDLQEDLNSLPEEDKDEISKLLHIKSKGINAPASSFSGSNTAIDIGKTSHGNSSVKKPGMSMLGMSLGSANAHVSGNANKPEHIDSVNSIASAGPIPPKEANATEGKAIAGSNNATPRSNGAIGSGAGLLFHKVGMLDISKSAPEIPVLGHTSTANELNAPSVEDTIDDMKEGLVETIEAKLNANPKQAEAKGFDHRYKHWAYKGISLDEMSIKDLNELVKLIE